MTITTVSWGNPRALTLPLRTAQAAIHLPDVQEMLRKLAVYQLGVFMPHMHDEATGDFRPLPAEVTQVEAGLQVSFQPTQAIAKEPDRFLPVGWFWRASATTLLACEMIREQGPGETPHYDKHKMGTGI